MDLTEQLINNRAIVFCFGLIVGGFCTKFGERLFYKVWPENQKFNALSPEYLKLDELNQLLVKFKVAIMTAYSNPDATSTGLFFVISDELQYQYNFLCEFARANKKYYSNEVKLYLIQVELSGIFLFKKQRQLLTSNFKDAYSIFTLRLDELINNLSQQILQKL